MALAGPERVTALGQGWCGLCSATFVPMKALNLPSSKKEKIIKPTGVGSGMAFQEVRPEKEVKAIHDEAEEALMRKELGM